MSDIAIMLIEDSKTEASGLSALLEKLGVSVQHAEDLQDAHVSAATRAILLDLNLVRTAGMETFYKCRRSFPYLPIVVLTHNDSMQMASECMAQGACGYFVKERLNVAELHKALMAAVERQQQLSVQDIERRAKSLEMIGQLRDALSDVSDNLLGKS